MSADETIKAAAELLCEEMGAVAASSPNPAGASPDGSGNPARPARTYANQFPAEFAPPPELLDALRAAGWSDESWGNDAAPNWVSGCGGFRLWVYESDPLRRESKYGQRFVAEANPNNPDDYDNAHLFATDNVGFVVGFVTSHNSADARRVYCTGAVYVVGSAAGVGAGDGAYDLAGEFPVSEFCDRLRDALRGLTGGTYGISQGRGPILPSYLSLSIGRSEDSESFA